MVVGLGEVFRHDTSIGKVVDLPLEYVADRKVENQK